LLNLLFILIVSKNFNNNNIVESLLYSFVCAEQIISFWRNPIFWSADSNKSGNGTVANQLWLLMENNELLANLAMRMRMNIDTAAGQLSFLMASNQLLSNLAMNMNNVTRNGRSMTPNEIDRQTWQEPILLENSQLLSNPAVIYSITLNERPVSHNIQFVSVGVPTLTATTPAIALLNSTERSKLVTLSRTSEGSSVVVNVSIEMKVPPQLVGQDAKKLDSSYYRTGFSGSVNVTVYFGPPVDVIKDMWRQQSTLFTRVVQYSVK